MVRAYVALGVLALCACKVPPSMIPDIGVPLDADAGSTTECGPTLKPAGKACVPVLDTCPGNQVPVPGGGCRRVGVEACAGGLKGPPDWTCKRVGTPESCLPGWAMSTDGWCEPVLPTSDCPDGTMEVIGEAACQPIADCGSGTYGNIKVTADTVFVDQAYAGTDSDGSLAKPFTTVGAALKAVAADRKAHIAVAAGVYKNEELSVSFRSVALEGRCPQMVTIEGVVTGKSSKVSLRGLTLRAQGIGVTSLGGVMELDRVAVVGCDGIGVYAAKGAKVVITDAVVAENHGYGILVEENASAEVERSIVRDTEPTPDETSSGIGVWVKPSCTLTLRDSVVSGNHFFGVNVTQSSARIERSVIRRTETRHPDGTEGFGVYTFSGEVEIADALVASNHGIGVSVVGVGAKATVERTVVRDTVPAGKGLGAGEGIFAWYCSLVVRDSVVARNRYVGVLVEGGTEPVSVVIERTLIRDTLPYTDGTGGHGVGVTSYQPTAKPATLTISDSIVANNRTSGVGVYAVEAKLERTLVQNTLPLQFDETYGIGVLALARVMPDATQPARLSIKDSTITGSSFAGVAVYGSEATVHTTVVRDTRELASRRWGGPGVLASSLGQKPSQLELKDSLVEESSDFGVYVEGSQARLERVAIRDTRSRLGDQAGGIGVYAWPGKGGIATDLKLRDCQVSKSGTAGVHALDAPLDVQRCQVTHTSGDSEGYGDGIVAAGAKTKLLVLDSLVQDSLRCGLLTKGANGLVDRSMLTKGTLSVVVDQGAQLQIGPRVELSGNKEDRLTIGENITTPPPPVVPPPPETP